MFHIKNVNNKKNLTEERKIMRNCAPEILIPTFINSPQNEAWTIRHIQKAGKGTVCIYKKGGKFKSLVQSFKILGSEKNLTICTAKDIRLHTIADI